MNKKPKIGETRAELRDLHEDRHTMIMHGQEWAQNQSKTTQYKRVPQGKATPGTHQPKALARWARTGLADPLARPNQGQGRLQPSFPIRFSRASCHTCSSKENQVQTYMYARIKFHANSDI
jgi:hypothetical protein